MAAAAPHMVPPTSPATSRSKVPKWSGLSASLSFSPSVQGRTSSLRHHSRIRASSAGRDASPNQPPSSSAMKAITEDVEMMQQREDRRVEKAQAKEKADARERERRWQESHQPRDDLAPRWREVAGRDNWVGMLDPFDPLLRAELIRYGEFAQACYDAFDFDPYSRYCGGCKYSRRSFFQSLDMANAGYEVTRYLYATSNVKLPNFSRRSKRNNAWSESANWIGYIAVSDDATTVRLGRRDIVVCWRGTVTQLEFIADLVNFHQPVYAEGIPCPDRSVQVAAGFVNLYTDKNTDCRFSSYSVRDQVLAEVRRQVLRYAEERGEEVSISMTGHSLGAPSPPSAPTTVIPVTVYSFAGPRLGNEPFKERFEEILGLKSLRVVNVHDVVPKVPGLIINENVPEFMRRAGAAMPWSYCHVGVKLALDHKRSPFLKDTAEASCFHNLEAYLHLLDG
ncbi:unnamed protein product [Spirodela intermedia]|uniref:Fungal lipase-type domain-containing protein n=1 Tax=Spirodela intermedia TaxID=51605 RepID=A0A7I8I8X1_SPIIN|nr:unnamed protein product [Spirodela intermedia]CAA6654060.1 unnamed protein product [Spirodela intermedia]